ncbi:MAG: pirin family protein [Arenicella sp.]|nr:pirin family protein [Arenicella sp.]
MSKSTARRVRMITDGEKTSDGAGVKMTRLIASHQLDMLDPFLLLDHFESDNPDDYIGGFPSHPHRGFETVTYMLAGNMRHKDSAGNEGVIGPHGVQWMTAGSGIIHSEMPEQSDGLMSGFQLWVNLPAKDKMTKPAYQELSGEQFTVEQLADGGHVRVIAGVTDCGTRGAVTNHYVHPLYLHVSLPAGSTFKQSIDPGHNAFVYVIEGSLAIGPDEKQLGARQLAVLQTHERDDHVSARSDDAPTEFLLVAGQPLNEPIARHGPFVMNTREEIMQAIDDFNNHRLVIDSE